MYSLEENNNNINNPVSRQLGRCHTICGREWAKRSTYLVREMTYILWRRMGGNEINIAIGVQVRRRRTAYG